MTPWVRLWREMPHDPKFRAIAKRSGRPVSDVVAVFVTMMTAADDDGDIGSWDADDIAAGLDLEASAVASIRDAMTGKVIEGNRLMGWEKRQPKRIDDSKDRVRAFRERKRLETPSTEGSNACNDGVTQCNAPEETRLDKKEDSPPPPKGGRTKPTPDGEGKAYEAFSVYNATAQRIGLPMAASLTPQRKRRLDARLREHGLEGWTEAMQQLEASPFLRGDSEGGWRANIDFCLQATSLTKLIEGAYAGKKAAPARVPAPENGKSWGWWRDKPHLKTLPLERWEQILEAAKPNGRWPWSKLGPPPGDPECLVPLEIVERNGWLEVYRGQITH
jgi:hypothetical protein